MFMYYLSVTNIETCWYFTAGFFQINKSERKLDQNYKSLKTLRFKPNFLLQEIKSETNIDKFKEYVNQCFGPKCKCKLCHSKMSKHGMYDLGFDSFNIKRF